MGSGQAPESIRRMAERYSYRDDAAQAAPGEVARILEFLGRTLERQQQAGSRYLVGDSLSAADLYWAAFSNIVSPMPPGQCPMPDFIRTAYAAIGPVVESALNPLLLAHRDFVWAEHIGLPMDFLPTP